VIKSRKVFARISFIELDFFNVDPCSRNALVSHCARTYNVSLALVRTTHSFTLNLLHSAF